MSKKKKKEQKPKISVSVASDNIRASKEDYRSLNFTWVMSEQYLDYPHEKYGWNNVSYHEFCSRTGIMRKLLNFEKKKWSECEKIAGSHKHFSWHPVEYENFPKKERQYLTEKYSDKVDCFYQISLSGKERIIGYKNNNVFYPIWFDKNHELFPCKK